MTKKEIIKNQILTDVEMWLEDYGKNSDNNDFNDWHYTADEAAGIMAKIKNYLTMGDDEIN